MTTRYWTESFRSFAYIKMFLTSFSTVPTLLVIGSFVLLYWMADDRLAQRMREQASTYADLILLHTQGWNVDYGGGYVQKKADPSPASITGDSASTRT